MKNLVLAALIGTISLICHAQYQVSDYHWSYVSGTYTEITGGTSLGNYSTNDQYFLDPANPAGAYVSTGPGFPIGFDFAYAGYVFDRVGINANGWITLGQSALTPSVIITTTSGTTPLFSTADFTPPQLVSRIAGFAGDLQAQTNATLRIQTVGTAPNREFVTQWKNYKIANTTGNGDIFCFQIRLQETTNKILMVYGTIAKNANSTTIQVGLRGQPPTPATNWKDLAGSNWISPCAGTTNMAKLTLTNVYYPPSGTTYIWTPPVDGLPPYPAMVASPADGSVQVNPAGSLIWASGGQMPAGYNLYFGTSNPPPLIGDMGSATSYNPGGMPLNTTYYWKVIPYNAYGSPPADDCPVWSFTTHNGLPALLAPADGATNQSALNLSFSWTAAPGSTASKIRIGTTSGGNDVVNMLETTSPYVHAGPLAYGTTYYWSVFSVYPDSRIEYQSVERTFTTRPAVTNFPYSEDFGTTGDSFPPTNWTKHNGTLANPTVLGNNGTGLWTQDDWLNLYPANKAAACNIYGNYASWLISPPLVIPEEGYDLSFDLALMAWNTNNPPDQSGEDDKFAVLIGDGASWTPANVARQWDNISSDYVYNELNNFGTHFTIPMGAAGTKYIAFYGVSTASNADNDLMIDNVQVAQTPHQAVLTLMPDVTVWDFGPTLQGYVASQRFTVTNTGGTTLNISSLTVSGEYFSLSEALTDYSLNMAESAYFTVSYAPLEIDSLHTGSITITDDRAVMTVGLTGQCYDPTVSAYPYAQNFDGTWISSPAAPYGWRIYNANADDFTWRQANTYITPTHSEPYAAEGMGNTNDWLISPPFDLTNSYAALSWWDKVESELYPNSYKVMVSTTTPEIESFTVTLGTYTCSNTVWTQHTISLGSFHGQTVYVAYYQYASPSANYGFGIDDVSVVASPPGMPEHVALDSPVNGAQDLNPTNVVLRWSPQGAVLPTYYEIFVAEDPIDPESGYWGEYTYETYDTFLNLSQQPDIDLGYDNRWYWAVLPYNGTNSPAPEDPGFAIWFFETMPDPRAQLPNYSEFTSADWPEGWSQFASSGINPGRWTLSYTSNAGGSPYEMRGQWDMGTGVVRLISRPLDTTGVGTLNIRFKHFWDDYQAGIDYAIASVEYSHNLVDWHNAGWTLPSGGGNTSGTVNLYLSGLDSPITWISWTVSGMQFFFDYWYIDDVLFSVPVVHNALPLSFDFPEAMGDAPFAPQVTVLNSGDSPESFNVRLQIGTSYLQTQSVAGLAPNTSAQVTFPQFTPVVNTAYELTATTLLAGDLVPGDDVLSGTLVSLPLHQQAFCDVGNTPDSGLHGPSTFWMDDPGNVIDLPAPHTHNFFLRGSDWINGEWYAPEYFTNYWFHIDHVTGQETLCGVTGVEISSVAWDPNHGILYGSGFQQLYTMDPQTGVATYVGPYTHPNGTMVGIAYDAAHDILYGVDLAYDALFTINPATGATILVGQLGVNIAYAQDCAFDQNNGYLYLAGYITQTGSLYWIDTDDGSAWKIANFSHGCEITSFAIPYGWEPEVSIAADGTLSWPALGYGSLYKVYGSTDPYGGFTLLTATTETSWLDPDFPQAKKFYFVTRDNATRNTPVLRKEGNPFQRQQADKEPYRDEAGLEAPKTH